MIEDRNLKPGTRLVGHYHKVEYRCTVIEGEKGSLLYRLDDEKGGPNCSTLGRRVFKSISAAGSAVMGHAANGWRFWSIAKDELAPARRRDAKGHYLPKE